MVQKTPPEVIKEMIELYKEGYSCKAIGEKFNCSKQAVSEKLRKNGFCPAQAKVTIRSVNRDKYEHNALIAKIDSLKKQLHNQRYLARHYKIRNAKLEEEIKTLKEVIKKLSHEL